MCLEFIEYILSEISFARWFTKVDSLEESKIKVTLRSLNKKVVVVDNCLARSLFFHVLLLEKRSVLVL